MLACCSNTGRASGQAVAAAAVAAADPDHTGDAETAGQSRTETRKRSRLEAAEPAAAVSGQTRVLESRRSRSVGSTGFAEPESGPETVEAGAGIDAVAAGTGSGSGMIGLAVGV
jgi:hypothetical protein